MQTTRIAASLRPISPIRLRIYWVAVAALQVSMWALGSPSGLLPVGLVIVLALGLAVLTVVHVRHAVWVASSEGVVRITGRFRPGGSADPIAVFGPQATVGFRMLSKASWRTNAIGELSVDDMRLWVRSDGIESARGLTTTAALASV